MRLIVKHHTLFFKFFFIISTFIGNAQIEKKENTSVYRVDKEGNVEAIKGYDLIEMDDKILIYEEAKWQPVKMKGGIIGLVERGNGLNRKKNDYSGCKKCKNGDVCVIKGDSCVCQKKIDCNCGPNEMCLNGNCEPLEEDRKTKLKKIVVY